MFMPFLSQVLCTNEAENIVIFLSGATTTYGCGPFTNYLSV